MTEESRKALADLVLTDNVLIRLPYFSRLNMQLV